MKILLFGIAAYQKLASWLRDSQVPGFTYTSCKFQPTCSEYAELAVRKHGPVRGTWKAFIRVLRCNPFSAGGVDYPS